MKLPRNKCCKIFPRSRGFIPGGTLIVAEGALVDEDTFVILNSLRNEFTLQQEGQSSFWIIIGYQHSYSFDFHTFVIVSL